jgi:hypothetical protein
MRWPASSSVIVTNCACNAADAAGCDEGGTTSLWSTVRIVFPEILSKSFILNI